MPKVTFTIGRQTPKVASAYATDPRWRTYPVTISLRPDSLEVDGIRGDRFVLFVTVELEGFGRTCLPMDGADGVMALGTYDLAVELLRSRIARCRRLSSSATAPEWAAVETEAEAALASGDAAACSRLLGQTIIAGEELLYQRCLGQTPPNDRVALVSATLFGERQGKYSIGVGPDWRCDAPPDFTRNPRSIELALDLVTATTLPSFWRYIEYEEGKPQWDRIDRILGLTRGRRLAVKSFALYWGGIGGCPPWFRTLSYTQQLSAIEKWVKTVVTRYKGEIACWETVNEMHDWGFGNPFGWNHDQLLEVTRMVNELVGALDPRTPRLINHCSIWGDYVQSGSVTTWTQKKLVPHWTPLLYLDEVCAAGIPFETIGLQFYNPGRDILTCYETVEQFLKFGKHIQVTEMGTPSAPPLVGKVETGQIDPMAGWRGTWTEDRQAVWLDRFFRTVGVIPKVTALNYWDFDDAQAYISHAGLVAADYHPKPGYYAVRESAQKMRSRGFTGEPGIQPTHGTLRG